MFTAEQLKKISEEMKSDFVEFKDLHKRQLDEIKKNGATTALLEEQIQKVNKSINALEAKHAEALKDLEAKAKDPSPASGEEVTAVKAYYDAFEQWAKKGTEIPIEIHQKAAKISKDFRRKAMIASDDTLGGYLAPPEYITEIIKTVTEFSPVRQLARVRPTSRRAVKAPTRTGQFAGTWVAEQGTRSETTGLTYGLKEIPNHEVYARVDISVQDLEDSAFNLEAEIRSEMAEQFAVAEGTAFISGNGVGKPEGIITGPISTTSTTGANETSVADDYISIFYDLKDAYARNSTWLFKRGQIEVIRKFVDSVSGQYLWQPGLASDLPPTFLGRPYLEAVDLDVELTGTAGKNIALFGDFRRGYVISDRTAMDFVRDPFSERESGNIKFMGYKRVGGQIVLAEAIRKLVTA